MCPDLWHIPTSDEEIVDVFVEEVGDLLDTIDSHLKSWLIHPSDKKALTEIRRCFHTLKGSGRMVKALDLSEMAWRIEKMLNLAIAGSIPASEAMANLVAAVRAQVPKMLDGFRAGGAIGGSGEIEGLMKLADAFAAGRTPAQMPAVPATTAVATAPPIRLEEVNRKLERFMQRADEALHRSEMALQQARRVSALSDQRDRLAEQRPQSAELERLVERINTVSRDLLDLRLESKQGQRDSLLQQSEINQVIEQRMRARLVPIERLHNELRRDLGDYRRDLAALRRFRWLGLVASAILGGVIAAGLLVWIQSLA